MCEEILIDSVGDEIRVALVDVESVEEIYIEHPSQRGLAGNIYKGKVIRVLPGMQSAFIDIGLEKNAFLHVADIAGARRPDGSLKPIETLIHSGDALMVQVFKDPIGTKGARVTTLVSIAGHELVFLPQERHIGVSQRIDDIHEKERLKTLLSGIVGKDFAQGYIIRTCADGATSEDFLHDIAYLNLVWEEARQKFANQPAPSLLFEDLHLEARVLRDIASENTSAIRVQDPELARRLASFAQKYLPFAADKISFSGDRDLFEKHHVNEEIQKALNPRVDLKSGGYLIIEQTEAMVTIDVNTGAFVGRRDFSDTIFKTNLEAAQAIARQLRLRSLGGIIIIDFIDMENPEHEKLVLDELKKALSRDRVRTSVSPFSNLGLVEMTRKRVRESLSHVLSESCPYCHGKGEVKTKQTVCHEIYREIVRMADLYPNIREFRIVACADVINTFLEEKAHDFDSFQETIARPVTLIVEPSYTREDFDVTFR